MTLFADASLCPETGAGGWGAWMKRDDWGRGMILGGQLACPLKSSTTAELCGIACGLWHARDRGYLIGIVHLMIQCDNLSALGLLRIPLPEAKMAPSGDKTDTQWLAPVKKGAYDRLTDTEKQALEVVKGALYNPLCAVSLRHVKGHGTGETGRSWVNEQCDAEAYRQMTSLRKQLRRASNQVRTQEAT